MVSAGTYILGVAGLALLALSLGLAAVRLRRRLLPTWTGPPAVLVDAVVAVTLLIWLSELLGTIGLLYAWTLVPASALTAGAIALWLRPSGSAAAAAPAGDADLGDRPRKLQLPEGGGSRLVTGPAAPEPLWK